MLGSGSYGPTDECRIKEQADHNLKYPIAVALLDGPVLPEQFAPDRINRPDVQGLLRKMTPRPSRFHTRRIPHEMHCDLAVTLSEGTELRAERTDHDGFFSRPMGWNDVAAKLERLATPFADAGLRAEIVTVVRQPENLQVSDLTTLLARTGEGMHA